MKLIASLVLLSASQAFAAAPELPECKAIVQACEGAGFTVDQKAPDKNLWMKCVAPRAADKAVAGVNTPAAEAKKCLDAVKSQYKGHGH